MVIKRWIGSLFRGNSTTVDPTPAVERPRVVGPKPLLDVAQEALRQEAAHLQGLVRQGTAKSREEALRRKVRDKVSKAIHPALSHPTVVEEVTERITLAALEDTRYGKLFDDDPKS